MSCNPQADAAAIVFGPILVGVTLFLSFCIPFYFYHLIMPSEWWNVRLPEMSFIEVIFWIFLFWLGLIEVWKCVKRILERLI